MLARFRDIPTLQRRMVWMGTAPAALVAIVCAERFVRTRDDWVLAASTVGILLAVGWCAWLRLHLIGRARKVLIQTRGLTCTRCGYCLVGMDENGACPECGCSYYADHLNDCWSRAAGFPTGT